VLEVQLQLVEIDLGSVASLRSQLAALDPTQVVLLDMSAVQFCDSSGIGVLVEAHRRHSDAGGSVRLRKLQEPVRNVFSIMGLDQLFDIGSA
jgi:anti-sigma B factor antagonist